MIRTRTNTLIWILSNNITQINRTIYLQLGADLVVDLMHEEVEILMLQLENALNRAGQGADKKTITKNPLQDDDFEFQLLYDKLSVRING